MNIRAMAETKKFKYKNQSGTKQALVGYGEVESGKMIETDEPVHNPNFILVDAGRMTNVEAPAEQPKAGETIKGSKK